LTDHGLLLGGSYQGNGAQEKDQSQNATQHHHLIFHHETAPFFNFLLNDKSTSGKGQRKSAPVAPFPLSFLKL
jgi:hypothetical protein